MADIYGTDIDDAWDFTDGDINLVSNVFNLGQAIRNRLMCDSDFYKSFYARYGGHLFDELGESTGDTLEYLRIEIESILEQEPRIKELECTVNKISTNTVECKLKCKTINDNEIVELNLVISQDSSITITEIGGS